jgi:hypothetical protein
MIVSGVGKKLQTVFWLAYNFAKVGDLRRVTPWVGARWTRVVARIFHNSSGGGNGEKLTINSLSCTGHKFC